MQRDDKEEVINMNISAWADYQQCVASINCTNLMIATTQYGSLHHCAGTVNRLPSVRLARQDYCTR